MKTIYIRATPTSFDWSIALKDRDESVHGKVGAISSRLKPESCSDELGLLEYHIIDMVGTLRRDFGSLEEFRFEYGFDPKSSGRVEAELDVLKHGPKYESKVMELLKTYVG